MSLIIVLITIGISVLAFNNQLLQNKLSLKPSLVFHRFQVYRVFTHGFVHADWAHLLVNMYVLYIFGRVSEMYFSVYFEGDHRLHFILLYFISLMISSLYSIIKHKNNSYYTAVGASGAVMAVVFASIFFDPWNKLYFFGVIPIPGIVFGALYLIYSFYMGKRNADNIGHDAHLTGAVFGFVYPVIIRFDLINLFVEKLLNP